MTVSPTTKLWLVYADYVDNQEVIGIFTSEELAEKFVEDCEARQKEIRDRGITEEEEQLHRDAQYWEDAKNGKYGQTMFTEKEEEKIAEKLADHATKINKLRIDRLVLVTEKELDFTWISRFEPVEFTKGINNGTI